MKHYLNGLTAVFAALLLGGACTANVDSIDVGGVGIDARVNNVPEDGVEAGSAVSVSLDVGDDWYLIAPDQTPPAEEADRAAHIECYLDDESSTPLLITASTQISVTIPEGTSPGTHVLIFVLVKHDGTVTDHVSEVQVKVKAKVIIGG